MTQNSRPRRSFAALLPLFVLGSLLMLPETGLGAPRTVVGELYSADG